MEGTWKVAEWAGFEKTSLWYIRLGHAAKNLELPLKDVLEEYKQALVLDPNSRQASHTFATTLGDMGDHADAIEAMKRARLVNLNASEGSNTSDLVSIALWQEAIGNSVDSRRQAMETLSNAMREYLDDVLYVSTYIAIAGKDAHYKAIMSALQNFGKKLPDILSSVNADEYLHKQITRAAQRCKRIPTLKEAYKAAVETASGKQDTEKQEALLTALGRLYSESQELEVGLGRSRSGYT